MKVILFFLSITFRKCLNIPHFIINRAQVYKNKDFAPFVRQASIKIGLGFLYNIIQLINDRCMSQTELLQGKKRNLFNIGTHLR